MEEYECHLPSMPEATPILLKLKEELLAQNNYEYGDLHMDVVRFNPNYGIVKVEMNYKIFYQKQEPIDETDYNIGIMQEQEQEVSNNHYNNSVFSCPEMELTTSDIYMQREVEEKVDLNNISKNPG
ncbi:unnamed protein product [Macrosiphum euphorbiae]|uniref:Uncharacterized protein n=1 Tax=Macrosiphum euphorbiae TaxID=13131 RepID=A0AAV0XM98_9HEMI|nr:unnamed protein product [Macrosiphum euphorbiae]